MPDLMQVNVFLNKTGINQSMFVKVSEYNYIYMINMPFVIQLIRLCEK